MSVGLVRAPSWRSAIPFGVAVALLLFGTILLAAALAEWLAPFDPARQTLILRLRPPGYTTAAGAV
jgi:peptide/nickel transport system permease protein